jgi:heme-degrading monooxygenase HmoA
VLIENLTFRLAAGTDESAFLDADRKVQTDFIPNLPGFVRRTTARGDGGEWLVVTLWGSAEAADAATDQAVTAPEPSAFMALVDPASVTVTRYATLD